MNTPAIDPAPTSAPISGGTPSDSPKSPRQTKKPIVWAPRHQRWIANAGYGADGKRRRRKFQDYGEAAEWRKQQLAADDDLSSAAVNLPAAVRLDVAAALAKLNDAGREMAPGFFSSLVADELRRSPDARTTLFAEVVTHWLQTKADRKLKPRSIADCEECITPFLGAFAHRPIGKITREEIEAILRPYKDIRKRNLWSKVNGVFTEARRRRLVLDNPAEGIILPLQPEREPTPLAANTFLNYAEKPTVPLNTTTALVGAAHTD